MIPLTPSSKKPFRYARVWSCGLIILFLISIFVLAFHHHDDFSSHSDCPICIALNLPLVTNNSANLFHPLFQSINHNLPKIITLISILSENLIDPRAPPSI